jgi:hypothetical protein
MAAAAPTLWKAARERWQSFLATLDAGELSFLEAKWRLSDGGWEPGDIVRRPRSADELSELLDIDASQVRDIDARMVARFAGSWQDPWWDYLHVPIDGAAAWWDRVYGPRFRPDGSYR